MRRFLLLLCLLVIGCAIRDKPPKKIYLPSTLGLEETKLVTLYPGQQTPQVLFDQILKIGGAYLDLLTLARSTEIEGQIPEPAAELASSQGAVSIVGRATFDWPIVVYRKELKEEDVRHALDAGEVRLLGQAGEALQLYLPCQDELALARIMEQWDEWAQTEPHLEEEALVEISYLPLAKGVVKADITLLMKSQWENLKAFQSANVVAFEHLAELSMPESSYKVAPWGLVAAKPDQKVRTLAEKLPQTRIPPQGSTLSTVTRSSARLQAHKLFPKRFGRRSSPGES